jgi:hypothetical protein
VGGVGLGGMVCGGVNSGCWWCVWVVGGSVFHGFVFCFPVLVWVWMGVGGWVGAGGWIPVVCLCGRLEGGGRCLCKNVTPVSATPMHLEGDELHPVEQTGR